MAPSQYCSVRGSAATVPIPTCNCHQRRSHTSYAASLLVDKFQHLFSNDKLVVGLAFFGELSIPRRALAYRSDVGVYFGIRLFHWCLPKDQCCRVWQKVC
jgi:hypothetical protein